MAHQRSTASGVCSNHGETTLTYLSAKLGENQLGVLTPKTVRYALHQVLLIAESGLNPQFPGTRERVEMPHLKLEPTFSFHR